MNSFSRFSNEPAFLCPNENNPPKLEIPKLSLPVLALYTQLKCNIIINILENQVFTFVYVMQNHFI
jgi:hypothetical protein